MIVDSELWLKEKAALSSSLKDKIIGDKESLTYDELIVKELPDFLRIYLKSQARKFLREEKPVLCQRTERYRFDDPEVQETFERLMGMLLLKTKFTKAELQRWVDSAISFQIQLLVRPREALQNLFFKRDKTRKREDIVKLLRQLSEGRAYMLRLAELLQGAKKDIDRQTFEHVAKRAEEETYGSKPLEAFLVDVSTLEDFFSLSGRTNGEFLTTAMIVGLLRARSLDDIAEGMEETAVARGVEYWTYQDVEAALERQLVLRGLSEASANQNAEAKGEVSDQAHVNNGARSEILEEAIREARSAVASSGFLENLFAPAPPAIRITPKPTERKASAPRISFGVVEEDDGVLVVDRKIIEKQPPGPYPTLRSLISNRERKAFIKKLFDKDKGTYHAFIDKLEQMEKWKDAKLCIDNELSKRQHSPFCREAVRLGDLVFSRYFSKNS